MITKIIMPQLGTTMTEGTVDKWLKSEGDSVKKGEAILEISTDKYTSEIESEVDGIFRRIIVAEGEDAPVLAVLGFITDTADEPISQDCGGTAIQEETSRRLGSTGHPAGPKDTTEASSERIIATPLARKTAAKLGIDLAEVTTSHIRIKQDDVLQAYKEKSSAEAQATDVTKESSNKLNAGNCHDVPLCEPLRPLTAMRRVIAARMTESIVTAPQVTELREARADALIAFRNRINASSQGIRVSYGDIIAKMVSTALINLPAMNASLVGDKIRDHNTVNIGVAVALDDGLVVPVIRNVECKGILQIAQESVQLIERARNMKLTPDETSGATFTISNLGGFGVDGFTPIVNLPESGILGLGRITRKPVINENDQVVPGTVITLSLTFDHRIIDGATAAKLLAKITAYVENPEEMLL